MRLHDRRPTVGIAGGLAGVSAVIIRDRLGHTTLAMTNRYVQHDVHPMRTAADFVAKRIAQALDGNAEPTITYAESATSGDPFPS